MDRVVDLTQLINHCCRAVAKATGPSLAPGVVTLTFIGLWWGSCNTPLGRLAAVLTHAETIRVEFSRKVLKLEAMHPSPDSGEISMLKFECLGQVWIEYWLQPLEQAGLQLLPIPLDSLGRACSCGAPLLYSFLPAGLQEGIIWTSELYPFITELEHPRLARSSCLADGRLR